ncbi:MAG: DUF465 domain-containing protein [Rhodospirillaceae bacterium]|nr:DUF465 domain-containing protein [Rhodospirillaceae bacterium]
MGDTENTDYKLEALKVKHARLEGEIHDENSRPQPDFVHITELKREKLKIKDELSRMTR